MNKSTKIARVQNYIDAHCHLADRRFDETRDDVLRRAREKGISRFIQGGVGPEDWRLQRELAKKYPDQVFPCFGLHPWWIDEACRESDSGTKIQSALERLVDILRDATAVGEVGLDFGPRTQSASHEAQRDAFHVQLELAQEIRKPIVLHVVGAHPEALAIIKEKGPWKQGGLVHAFNASRAIGAEYVKMGFMLSVGGAIARKGYERLKEAVTGIAIENLVIESDAPDQSPPGFEGKLNEPVSLFEVAAAVGELKGMSAEKVLESSRDNLERMFQWN